MNPRTWSMMPLVVLILLASGCAREGVDTTYGRARDQSINGTGTLVELFRGQGHAVRTAVRLSDELADWADVIVRFAPYPGPPEREESDWYLHWLNQIGERKMIYVVRDYSALADYWQETLDHLPKAGADTLRTRARTLRDQAAEDGEEERAWAKDVARPEDWFAVNRSNKASKACKMLDGSWSVGVNPAKASLPRHETLEVDAETVLLEGDGEPLVIEWTLYNESRVLVAANASFLVNGALLNRARRPLAIRTVRWVGDESLNVAFVEGRHLLSGPPESPSVFALLKIWPFGWVVAQLMILGLAACLARAPRLGRPRPEPSSGEDRPVAHPEALGALLARTGQAGSARAILETYRRWRNPSSQTRGGLSPSSRSLPASVDSIENPSPTESLEHE